MHCRAADGPSASRCLNGKCHVVHKFLSNGTEGQTPTVTALDERHSQHRSMGVQS